MYFFTRSSWWGQKALCLILINALLFSPVLTLDDSGRDKILNNGGLSKPCHEHHEDQNDEYNWDWAKIGAKAAGTGLAVTGGLMTIAGAALILLLQQQ